MSPPESERKNKEPGNAPRSVPFGEALRVWARVALLSFGGPAGQIAVMHRILVEEKRWLSESRFLHALNYCMLLPGPEAQQLATYVGWLLHKTKGGLTAGVLFILPGFVSILVLSTLYASYRQSTVVEAIFFGIKPAVMAVVVEAVIRIGRRALKNNVMVLLAAAAFVAIFFFGVPFPLIILCAAAIGFAGGRMGMHGIFNAAHEEEPEDANGNGFVITSAAANHTRPTVGRAVRLIAVMSLLWLGPIAIIAAVLGRDSVFTEEGLFFSKVAVVTFGGAYAVLAYITQQAVDAYGWLDPGEMLDGLGMAETTPGPLIQVVQFVGFMGAYRNPGPFDPLTAGIIGSVVTTWATFVPCFLWIFLGAPYIENLRGNKSLGSALSAITAAVVGVILNLAVWFSIHTMFGEVNDVRAFGMTLNVPVWETVDPASVAIAAGAFMLIFLFRLGMIPTLALSAAAGLAYRYLVV
ncbi:MAG: chromate efflux transporter [Candidatus Dadabacteria bacterium]|nr:chromate efflux transporter [Candidatus Dadabacteria bacterium]